MVWSPPTLPTKATLVSRAMSTYGIDTDSELQTVVEGLLDDTIRDHNSHLYEFNKRVQTGIVLTGGTATYELAAATYKESLAYLVKTSDSTKQGPLVYLPYIRFRETYGDGAYITTGVPTVYTFRNLNNDGLVTLGAAPNTATAANYTLTVEYYRRIPLASVEDPIEGFPELATPLLYGLMKRLAIHLYGPAHGDVSAFAGLEQEALGKVKSIDKRHPDQQMRFRLVDHVRRQSPFGKVYITLD